MCAPLGEWVGGGRGVVGDHHTTIEEDKNYYVHEMLIVGTSPCVLLYFKMIEITRSAG